jgi:hypothetical protein
MKMKVSLRGLLLLTLGVSALMDLLVLPGLEKLGNNLLASQGAGPKLRSTNAPVVHASAGPEVGTEVENVSVVKPFRFVIDPAKVHVQVASEDEQFKHLRQVKAQMSAEKTKVAQPRKVE